MNFVISLFSGLHSKIDRVTVPKPRDSPVNRRLGSLGSGGVSPPARMRSIAVLVEVSVVVVCCRRHRCVLQRYHLVSC